MEDKRTIKAGNHPNGNTNTNSDNAIKPRKVPVLSNLSKTEISALSGAMAGFLSGVAVCPLDVAKTRLQAQDINIKSKLKYRGIFQTLTRIASEEGILGLYRGLIPITLGYFPTWMIYFTVYEKAKIFYPTIFHEYIQIDNNHTLNFLSYSFSAITAGAVSSTFTNPIWVVKTRLMLQTGNGHTIYDSINKTSNSQTNQNNNIQIKSTNKNKNYYSGTLNAFYKMYKNEGIKVFYSGLIPSLFGLCHVAIHFPVYEYFKKFLNCNINESNSSNNIVSNNLYLLKLILASSLSKMIASTLTYPHEVLRTRLQIRSLTSLKIDNSKARLNQKGDLIDTIKSIYKKEGLIGFYSGFSTNLVRTVPASAVTLVSYEYIKFFLINIVEPSTL
ncbi:mitochondrial carrier [Ascoidea rubescens DSM 1968]|uniref:Mitochondrial carrier n=1 Tax=Ascoidea rubescens DSM 1968 TaxID=1344418 RepID=A0A1D2VSC1_9ASCO|nr:mitochondrial carrier [Ascoidea rubescens DSM 1968]ODV64501.1 mitochondrial carrier [Ascoidea rubescens DSM 1968]